MAKKKERLKPSALSLFIYVFVPTSVVTLSIISDPRIASKVEYTSDCIDDLGTTRAHNDVWETTGGCDRNRCWHGTLKNYLIKHSCTEITDSYNPDSPNCLPVANTTLSFPGCCPVLSCATASPVTTISPTACYDRSSAFACSFWYNMTGGCQPGVDTYNDRLYNYTLIGCRQLCGHC
ncbi:uncharacterized protein LOC127727148 [Mytilus californianus]|uniref:uncharacterized protein LOC127727148 n=1 Tax=Mytilus californianus TaxID=6549 RepID=UPI002247EB9E|nr:uncharacterized protein LOC127727148 [Mytilus californianus]